MASLFKKDNTIKERQKYTLYDFIVLLYIVALYIFENKRFALVFTFIQAAFFLTTVLHIFIKRVVVFKKYYVWYLVFIVLCFILCVVANNSYAWSTLRQVLKNLLVCVCISIYLDRDERNIDYLIYDICIAGIATSFFLLFGFLSTDFSNVNLKYAGELRIGADIAGNNVNIIALYQCFAFSAILYKIKQSDNKKWRVALYVALFFVAATTLFTGSRKVLIFYIITFALFSLKSNKRNIILIASSIFIIYFLLMNIEPLYYLIGYKINIFGKNSTSYAVYSQSDINRVTYLNKAWELFKESPFGIGFGSTIQKMGIYSHNNFLEVLVSGGIIGFLIYYCIYLHIFIIHWANREKWLSQYFLITLFALLVFEIWQVTYLYLVPMIFLCCAAVTNTRTNRDSINKGVEKHIKYRL